MKARNVFCTLNSLILLTQIAQAQDDSLDVTFNPGSGANNTVYALALNTNAQVLVGGLFNTFNGQSRNYLTRLNADGSLDNVFLPLQGPGAQVYAIAVDSSGRTYIGGAFTGYNGITMSRFARLRDDASLDLSWPDVGFNNAVDFIQWQSSGHFVVLGPFTQIGATPRMNVARLNSDASVDGLFNPGAGVSDGGIFALALQPDGKIIIAGSFTTNSPVSRQFIARVTSNGSSDPTFNAGYIGGSYIQTLALQPDGKLVVAGPFTSINGYSRAGLARLNTNGTVDVSFVLPSSFGSIGSITLQPDGRVLLAGNVGLARVNTNGTYDAAFNPRVIGPVNALLPQPDGKLLVGGQFNSIAGTNMNNIARLNGFGTNSAAFQFLSINAYAGMFLSGVVSNNYRIEWTTNLNTSSLWAPLFDLTLQTNPQLIFDPSPMAGRQRFYRAVAVP